MKKIISIIVLFSIFPSFAFWEGRVLESCEYYWKYKECLEANQNWKNREITDFICRDSKNPFDIIFQIALDEEFRKIDKLAEQNILDLEKNKDKYFWPNAKSNILEAVDEIEREYSIYGDIWKAYNNACLPKNEDSIFKKTFSCFENWIPSEAPIDVLDNSTCTNLAWTKLRIYKQVSFDLLKINKVQVRADSKKELTQDQRKKYDSLIDLFMNNLNYLERIWKRWPSKTKDAM